ncbi:DUF1761 domain-containing protein [Hoeflea sp. TYP-13]|uniref:DUF1761 domain-containing protein n=1 Tax=Hoeflea sp. TYP-13 TaxID=3230023 RepID=UPI0034C5B724
MDFAGVSYVGILVATVAGFIIGGAYYGILGGPWMKAARINPDDTKMSPMLFINSIVCELIMAFMLAGVIGHLGEGQVTPLNGLISGFFIWLGFVATTLAVNHRYQGFGWDLTVIDGIHWLLVLLAMGAIIGWFDV